ncbi:hypothetical protein ACVWXO_010906 [Bradyrhizobium sp. LM2.7]
MKTTSTAIRMRLSIMSGRTAPEKAGAWKGSRLNMANETVALTTSTNPALRDIVPKELRKLIISS